MKNFWTLIALVFEIAMVIASYIILLNLGKSDRHKTYSPQILSKDGSIHYMRTNMGFNSNYVNAFKMKNGNKTKVGKRNGIDVYESSIQISSKMFDKMIKAWNDSDDDMIFADKPTMIGGFTHLLKKNKNKNK